MHKFLAPIFVIRSEKEEISSVCFAIDFSNYIGNKTEILKSFCFPSFEKNIFEDDEYDDNDDDNNIRLDDLNSLEEDNRNKDEINFCSLSNNEKRDNSDCVLILCGTVGGSLSIYLMGLWNKILGKVVHNSSIIQLGVFRTYLSQDKKYKEIPQGKILTIVAQSRDGYCSFWTLYYRKVSQKNEWFIEKTSMYYTGASGFCKSSFVTSNYLLASESNNTGELIVSDWNTTQILSIVKYDHAKKGMCMNLILKKKFGTWYLIATFESGDFVIYNTKLIDLDQRKYMILDFFSRDQNSLFGIKSSEDKKKIFGNFPNEQYEKSDRPLEQDGNIIEKCENSFFKYNEILENYDPFKHASDTPSSCCDRSFECNDYGNKNRGTNCNSDCYLDPFANAPQCPEIATELASIRVFNAVEPVNSTCCEVWDSLFKENLSYGLVGGSGNTLELIEIDWCILNRKVQEKNIKYENMLNKDNDSNNNQRNSMINGDNNSDSIIRRVYSIKLPYNGVSQIKIRRDKILVGVSGWDHRVRLFNFIDPRMNIYANHENNSNENGNAKYNDREVKNNETYEKGNNSNLNLYPPLIQLCILKYHSQTVQDIDFNYSNSTSSLIASCSSDKSIAIWKIY